MSVYPGTESEQRIDPRALAALVRSIFENCGMIAADAALLTDTLVAADLRGCHSHGVLRVPDYVRKLTSEGVDPRGRPRVACESRGAVVVDGGNSMGQIGSAFAMRKAIEKARTENVVLAAVRGSNHCGAMAYFVMMALDDGMIGLGATNALPTMTPWGGAAKILGINPLAAAFPAGREFPVVFDAAFSASSHGKIRVYHQKGLAIPEGWALDASGRPTTDASEALHGLLQPIGGYKGAGLALVMGVLSTLLSGASYGTELGDMVNGPRPGGDGHFYLAINIAAFVDLAVFRERVDRIIDEIHRCPPAPGFDRAYAPGEIEALAERDYRANGIPLNQATLDGLTRVAAALGADAGPIVREDAGGRFSP